MSTLKSSAAYVLIFCTCVVAFIVLQNGVHSRREDDNSERREYVLECRQEYSEGTSTASVDGAPPVTRAIALLPEVLAVHTISDLREYMAGTGPRPEIPCKQRIAMMGAL